MAAAISYHVLFSIFPLAIAAVGVLGLVAHGADETDTIVGKITKIVPLSDRGQQQVHDLLGSLQGSAGALGLLGIVGVLYSASGVMAAVRTALNVAWDTDDRRPFLRGKGVDLLLVAAVFVLLAVAIAVTALTSYARRTSRDLPHLLALLGGPVATAASIVVVVALLAGTFLFLYRVVPAVPTRVRDLWPGAAFAFLFFVYLVNLAFLLGAEIASERPRLRAEAAAASVQVPAGDEQHDVDPDRGDESGERQPARGSAPEDRNGDGDRREDDAETDPTQR